MTTTFRTEAPAIYERVRLDRAGMIGRDDLRWDTLADLRRRPEHKPWGGFRLLCRDDDGVAQAWASYKVESRTTDGRPNGTADVADLCGATPAAEARLWRFLTELDLIATVKAADRPVDDVLPWLLTDARAAKSSGARDFLWVRPLDVAALLTARDYTTAGRVVLEVVDDQQLSAGRFELDASPSGVSCDATTRSADLTLPVEGTRRREPRRHPALHAARRRVARRARARLRRRRRRGPGVARLAVVQHLVLTGLRVSSLRWSECAGDAAARSGLRSSVQSSGVWPAHQPGNCGFTVVGSSFPVSSATAARMSASRSHPAEFVSS